MSLFTFIFRLCNWLTKWYVNRKAKLPKPSPWAKNEDGGYYKAALLSGPPGVGKRFNGNDYFITFI